MMSNIDDFGRNKVVFIIPCYNEEVSIPLVIHDIKEYMPNTDIHVFDNNSSDDTAKVAKEAGALVHHVPLKGKGNVVRKMFADVDADIYIMVDGDNTYDISSAPLLVNELLEKNLDMVIGKRVEAQEKDSGTYRKGHRLGNLLLSTSVVRIFGGHFTDMLSGYRVFSRRYVKSFPALSKGFEIETELTVHALELRMAYSEVDTLYGSRPEGSASKLSTYKDGFRILKTIAKLYAAERPQYFYGILSAVLAFLSVVISIPVLSEYIHTGLVPRFPTALLSVGLMIIAIVSFFSGMILSVVTTGRNEAKRLAYLNVPKTEVRNEK